MSNARIQYLVNRFFEGASSEDERQELADWVNRSASDAALQSVLEEAWRNYEPSAADRQLGEVAMERVYARISEETDRTRMRISWWKPAAAAAVLLLAGLGIWKGTRPAQEPLANVQEEITNDVMPGGEKAVLTLSNGRQIVLDSAADGLLAQQGGTSVNKLSNGQLVYDGKDNRGGEIVYNTMTTPRGGQYRLTLPDGTKAWLNSASSITFPTAFAGAVRSVAITGEVYLEVSKDEKKPFTVKADGVGIAVLGTHFNVSAYPEDGAVRTTLLEGKVKVSTAAGTRTIAPGEQAQAGNGRLDVRQNVNLDQVMGWKNGRFVFEGEPIARVMNQLSRWYDVEVGDIEQVDDRFYLDLPRSKKLSDVLKALELTGKVKFKIEGKKIIVMK
ncbi:FecR family protein [Chitinophaga rhizosphaerae]|uniref:FecR family protein n=1 Tax=Chitinophaga rhizosphaerae TaxID=1864947 RepID=UPI000F809833|nr:FecR domain-containing protein [Chitinophaga rhizosphaerae]